jgi:hypothetical protein
VLFSGISPVAELNWEVKNGNKTAILYVEFAFGGLLDVGLLPPPDGFVGIVGLGSVGFVGVGSGVLGLVGVGFVGLGRVLGCVVEQLWTSKARDISVKNERFFNAIFNFAAKVARFFELGVVWAKFC